MRYIRGFFCLAIFFLLFISFVAGSELVTSCQNYPPPNFCSGEYIITANGTDVHGCTNWICVQQEKNLTVNYIVIDKNFSLQDNTTAYALKNYLENLLGSNFVFEIKYNKDFSVKDFDNRVTTFIYRDKALIINNGMDYGIIVHDHPSPGSPDKCAITTYLVEISNFSYLVIQRNSSDVNYANLKQEMYKGCKNAGESWLVRPETRYTVCCEGLDFLAVAQVIDGLCSFDQEHVICSNCGNGICEKWENFCSCPSDCKSSNNSINNSNKEVQEGNNSNYILNGSMNNSLGVDNSSNINNVQNKESKNIFVRIFKWFGKIFGRN
jgi:hypothetical protein